MNELKRFIRWCIKNDLAFTHIEEAIRAFRTDEAPRWVNVTFTDATTGCGRYPCICRTTAPCASSGHGSWQ